MNRPFFTELPDHRDFLCCRGSARQSRLLLGASRRAHLSHSGSRRARPLCEGKKIANNGRALRDAHTHDAPVSLHEMDASHGRASQLAESVLSSEHVEGTKGSNKACPLMRASTQRAGRHARTLLGRRTV